MAKCGLEDPAYAIFVSKRHGLILVCYLGMGRGQDADRRLALLTEVQLVGRGEIRETPSDRIIAIPDHHPERPVRVMATSALDPIAAERLMEWGPIVECAISEMDN